MKLSVFDYFKQGFKLVQKTYSILLLTLGTSIISLLLTYNGDSFIIGLIGFIFFFFYLGLEFSLVYFMYEIEKKQKLTVKSVLSVICKNTKRSIPFVFALLFLIVLYLVGMTMYFVITRTTQFDPFVAAPGRFVILLLMSMLVVFQFTSIFFSIENKNIFVSLGKSVKYSFKHLRFIGALAILYLVMYGFYLFLPSTATNFFMNGLRTLVFEIFAYFMSAISLIYYQHNKSS